MNTILEIWKERHESKQRWLDLINNVQLAREVEQAKCKGCGEIFDEDDIIGTLCEYCYNF